MYLVGFCVVMSILAGGGAICFSLDRIAKALENMAFFDEA